MKKVEQRREVIIPKTMRTSYVYRVVIVPVDIKHSYCAWCFHHYDARIPAFGDIANCKGFGLTVRDAIADLRPKAAEALGKFFAAREGHNAPPDRKPSRAVVRRALFEEWVGLRQRIRIRRIRIRVDNIRQRPMCGPGEQMMSGQDFAQR